MKIRTLVLIFERLNGSNASVGNTVINLTGQGNNPMGTGWQTIKANIITVIHPKTGVKKRQAREAFGRNKKMYRSRYR